MKTTFIITWVLLLVTLISGCNKSPVTITKLACEYLENPLGIDEAKPRLSWQLKSDQRGQKQTAFQLIVASSPEKLNNNTGDLWDSGKLKTDQSVHVEYNGKPLESGMDCYWKVRVWDIKDKTSNWSEPAKWSMGILNPEDWNAKWITYPNPTRLSHPWLRRTFDLKENVEQAIIHVNTPSYYELHINGVKATPYVLTPGISQVNKRFLINSYDVTSYLVKGKNCIAIWMGPGWHQPRNGNNYNAPVIRAQLSINSSSGLNTIGTDSLWRLKESCIKQIGDWKWNDFGGEHFDAREFVQGWNLADLDDSDWLSAREIPAPINLGDWEQRNRNDSESFSDRNIPVLNSWQACESAKPGVPVNPKKIYQLENGKWVLDFGRPLTGWMRLRMHNLKSGQEIHIEYADVNDNEYNRKLSHMSDSDGFQTFNQKDTYIGAGSNIETFCSRFNYHSFRYALISGLSTEPGMEDAEAMMIEPDLESSGSFECSNELFNQIHEITRYTYRTQNPCLALGTGEAREKSAYGDGGAHLSGYLYNFQVAANLRKWIRDWSDGQREDGFFGHTAPAFEDHGGGPAWGGQVSELVRRMYLYYGDKDIVDQMYERLRKYVDYVESKTQDGILNPYSPTEGSLIWRFIGDWVRPTKEPGNTFYFDTVEEREFFNNCYRVLLWQQLQDYAEITGRTDEYIRCSDHLATIRTLIHKTFFLEDKGTYTFNNQSCLTMALYAQIPPAKLRPEILAQLEHELVVNKKGHLDTGLLGTFLMLDLLIQENRNDLIALIMEQTTYPGWGYLIKELGLNTWPETWSGWGSHVILVTATPDSWFFEGLGGILPDPKKPGFKHFMLRPGIVGSVDWVKCSYQSPYGRIVSNWKKDGGSLSMEVTIPANTTATVYVPAKDKAEVTESGTSAMKAKGAKFLRNDGNAAVYALGSGTYRFQSTLFAEVN
jgi:alpha-L-rhamnosidase